MIVERVEEYLEAILDIQEKEKRTVRTGDVAKRLNVRPSSVTEMFIKLREMGYVDYVPYRGVVLTPKGREIAEKIKKYYRVFEKFFEYLGVNKEKAVELSCELEHHVDDDVLERVCRFISGVCNLCDECEFKENFLCDVGKGKYKVTIAPKNLCGVIDVDDTIEVVEIHGDVIEIKIGNETFKISKDAAKKIVVRRV